MNKYLFSSVRIDARTGLALLSMGSTVPRLEELYVRPDESGGGRTFELEGMGFRRDQAVGVDRAEGGRWAGRLRANLEAIRAVFQNASTRVSRTLRRWLLDP